MTDFAYHKPFPLGSDPTEYRLVTTEGIETTEFEGREILKVSPETLTRLANEAVKDISFMLRPSHLRQVASILDDEDATDNDRMVALTLLRNAQIQQGLDALHEYCVKWKLIINAEKSKITVFEKRKSNAQNEVFVLDGKVVETVLDFSYLGVTLSTNGSMKQICRKSAR